MKLHSLDLLNKIKPISVISLIQVQNKSILFSFVTAIHYSNYHQNQ